MYLQNMFSLKGKVALVTGGGRGIGQDVCLGLAEAGAHVAIFSRTGADETVAMIRERGGTANSFLVDVTSEREVDAGIEQTLAILGGLDIVFNNAGIFLQKDVFEATVAEWREILDVNLTGQFIVARAAARSMVRRNIKGSIINMASMSGSIVNVPQWQTAYNTSKAGVIHMSRSLAMEWVEFGIRVNSISPGYISTPLSDAPGHLREAWIHHTPMKRMGHPDELMPAILYLACDASSFTTGSDVVVDGGYTAL